jgi:hypothetical protein
VGPFYSQKKEGPADRSGKKIDKMVGKAGQIAGSVGGVKSVKNKLILQ